MHNNASSVSVNARLLSLAARLWQQFRPRGLDRVIQRIRHALVCLGIRMTVERRRKGLRIVILEYIEPWNQVERNNAFLPAQLDQPIMEFDQFDPLQMCGANMTMTRGVSRRAAVDQA